VDIPDGDDPDYPLYRSEGEVVEMIEDDAATNTEDEHDPVICRVRSQMGNVRDFR